MKKFVVVLPLITAFIGFGQIKFEDIEWKDALSKSKKENKLIFFEAYAGWSEPCRLIEKYAFSDLEVSNYFNENFINVRFDMETYPGVELAETFQVSIYPSLLFIDGNEIVQHRSCGAMDAGELLDLAKEARGSRNLNALGKQFEKGERNAEFLIAYLNAIEESCLNAEMFAQKIMNETSEEDLINESSFLLIEMYQWNIFSREFKYLLKNKVKFERAWGKKRVNDKIFNTYLSQYQEVFESEELHHFAMRALLDQMKNVSFTGSDTLNTMMSLHYYEIIEDWEMFSDFAIKWVEMSGSTKTEEINELAWKFYLFVEDPKKLKTATNWSKKVVDLDPTPTTIDTYASLLYKQGERKKAIELEIQAIEMAKLLFEDLAHYEHQLAKFKDD